MYILVSSYYPTDKTTEVVKTYLEAHKRNPPDETLGSMVVPIAVKTTEQGIKVIAILEVKKGKLEEALTRAATMMAPYHSIVGHEYSIDVYFSLTEALANIGMSLPK